MAKVTDVFLKGTVGNVVFYRRMGTNCARVIALDISQSAATKKRSLNFGIAARAGKALRSGLAPCMPVATDRSMQSRFSGAIAKWLGTSAIGELPPTDAVPFVSNMEFTKGQPVSERFNVPLTISLPEANLVTIIVDPFVPAKEISAPAGTGMVTLTISVAGCMMETGESCGHETHSIDILYNDTPVDAKLLEFHVDTPWQSLVVAAARLIYKKFENNTWVEMKKEAFMPAGVVYAAYRG